MTIEIEKARVLMEESSIDVMLISSYQNFVYTSGIYEPTMKILMESALLEQFTILPRESDPVLVINSALLENAEEVSWIEDVRTTPTGVWVVREKRQEDFAPTAVEGVVKVLKEKNLIKGKIGIEKAFMSINTYERLKSEANEANFFDITGLLQNLRAIKTSEEIEKLKKAIEITEKGYEAAMSLIREGSSDFDIIKEFKITVAQEGGNISHMNYGVGPKGGMIFSQPYGHKVKKGDIVRMDLGVEYSGYKSDLCRIAVLGEPSNRLNKLYRVLLEAQRKGIKEIKPGVKLRDVYNIFRETVREGGFKEYNRGMFGHSIGLECEEQPMITEASDVVFKPNMVFCIEIPWYEPGWGGVSVEDMLLVTDLGNEELSTLSRELRVIR